MAGTFDTFTKFINLRDTTNLTNTRFTVLCGLYEIPGMSDASLNRALQRKSFSQDVDLAVRPLILRIENLIESMKPLPVSFENVEVVKLFLDLRENLLDHGIDLQISTNNSSTAVSD